MTTDLSSWAVPRLAKLLPLDNESLGEIVVYTASLSKEAGADHLTNILGDSSHAFEFISAFNARRKDVSTLNPSEVIENELDFDRAAGPRRKPQRKSKAPLHHAGPVRQPEGYGNVSGSYQKSYGEEGHGIDVRREKPSSNSLAQALSLSQHTTALQLPQQSRGNASSPAISRDPSPGLGRPKLPPSASGNLISDLPNVRTKQSKKTGSQSRSGASTPRSQTIAATASTSSIDDLTSAIAALELATNPSLSSERQRCECNASIHPLFETAPNCLNCGKIICALEGLQPCSYCDTPILSREQVNSMIRALKDERGVERMASHNAGIATSNRGTPMFGGSTPDSSGDEGSNAAARARAHRDKLLAFQRENAQRTRVHDEVADFETTLTPGVTQWMSPMQRAAALKKQQRYMRELQEANRPEWEKKRAVMSMSIKNGKLVKTYARQKAPAVVHDDQTHDDTIDDESVDQSQIPADSKASFGNNPLLASGQLVRPIWPTNAQGKVDGEVNASTRSRNNVWRRVQDDDHDNEQWILDGGLRGYGTETRLMEDGSQQECG